MSRPKPPGSPIERTRCALRWTGSLLPSGRRSASPFSTTSPTTKVAQALKLPVGSVKTRIRTAVHKLRFMLAPLGVAAVAVAILIGGGVRFDMQRRAALRTDRALSMVTASDITTLHIPPAPGANPAAHGSYRGRQGTPLAVLALHNFTRAPQGRTYQAWVGSGGTWTSMGTAEIDSAGNALVVAEGSAFTALPAEVEVTVEPRGGRPCKKGRIE